MSSFSPDVKKFPGDASCALSLAYHAIFWWNRIHSGGTLSQSGTAEKLIGLRHFWESLIRAFCTTIFYSVGRSPNLTSDH